MEKLNTLDTQVDGDHYKALGQHQPIYIIKQWYGMPGVIISCVKDIIKYLSRFQRKGGLKDLYKARHYLDILIESVEQDQGVTPTPPELIPSPPIPLDPTNPTPEVPMAGTSAKAK